MKQSMLISYCSSRLVASISTASMRILTSMNLLFFSKCITRRYVTCFCLACLQLNKCLADGSDDMAPSIYADVSEAAVNDAVSFDGFHGAAGVSMIMMQYGSSLTDGNNFTIRDMSSFATSFGVKYARSFKSKLLIGLSVVGDVTKSKKEYGDWKTFNADYDGIVRGRVKSCVLKTDAITPAFSLNLGYSLESYKTAVFLKVGVSRVGGSYSYYLNGVNVADVDINAIVPKIGLEAERKINKKWGASFEINIPLKRTDKKIVNGFQHRIRVGRTEIRLLATYSMSDSAAKQAFKKYSN